MPESSPHKSFQVSRRTAGIFLLAACLLVFLNLLLLRQNHRLKSELTRLSPPEISVGAVLPPMRGTNLKGEEVTVNYKQDNRKTLLIVFAPDCPVCNESGSSWKKLIEAIDKDKFRVVAVSLVPEGTADYVNRHDLSTVSVLARIRPEDRAAYKLAQVPQLLLIEQGGKVEKVWTGAIRGAMSEDMQKSLGVETGTLSESAAD